MRAQWYGDKRDLVKWGVLLTLARQHNLQRILQVAYLRPSEWGPLEISGQEVTVPGEVVRHFRSPDRVTGLAQTPRIDVLCEPLNERRTYQGAVLLAIGEASDSERQLVFLDPDTGLAPKAPKLEHVLEEELAEIWRHLREGDVLAVYQHQTNRRGVPWLDDKRSQMASALGLPAASVQVGTGKTIARDVAILYCRKDKDVGCNDEA